MSDSELSDAPSAEIPSDKTLEDSLRAVVANNRRTESLSVNMVRKLSEKELGLSEGFYVDHPYWKSESKRIIKDEIEKHNATPSPPPETKKSPSPKRSMRDEPNMPKKKRKVSTPPPDEEDLSSPLSMLESEQEKPKQAGRKPNGSLAKLVKPAVKKPSAKEKPLRKSKSHPAPTGSDEDSQASEDVKSTRTKPKKAKSPPPTPAGDDSDSALSELIDEEPKQKKRRKSKEVSEKSSGKANKPKAKVDTEDDPDAAEIKRLQGWLGKCGIRKLWGKELKPYETPKAKIKHLRKMLEDVGMTGRYSQEKATQIKEQRELAADIEAVKEGAERWGRDGNESDEEERPKRRLVRGAHALDFLSSGGEETD